jgi:type 1 fimbriae regulatory protein FimB/type 1 fimbriae regulatory protein FimE
MIAPAAGRSPFENVPKATVEAICPEMSAGGARAACAILLAYRHGLRATELCSLRWSQIDLRQGRLHVNRAKGGCASVHPLHGPELRALRPLQGATPYVFVTEAGTPVTTAWFLRMVQRTGHAAGFAFGVHPHMLRHSTGYKLANDGQDHMVGQIDEKVIELPRLTRFEDTYLNCLDVGIEGCIAEWMEFAFDDDRCKMAPDEKDRLIASLHARLSVALHEAVKANPTLHEVTDAG